MTSNDEANNQTENENCTSRIRELFPDFRRVVFDSVYDFSTHLSLHHFEMGQIMKGLISMNLILIPIAAPTKLDPKLRRR